jgi:hypothetical protein
MTAPLGFSKIDVFDNMDQFRLDDGVALLFPARHAIFCGELPDRCWVNKWLRLRLNSTGFKCYRPRNGSQKGLI